MNRNIVVSQTILKFAFGLVLILIGLDKVFHTNILASTTWEAYVGPLALSVIPLTATTIVSMLGVAEIIVGALFFTKYTKLAAWISIVLLLVIIVNLFTLHLIDIAARDALLAISLYVYTLLTDTIEDRH